jgi:hypothetical protein
MKLYYFFISSFLSLIFSKSSDVGDFRFDRRMRIIADYLDVFVFEIVDIFYSWIELDLRQWFWFAGKLELGLRKMVGIKMDVAESVDEFARLQTGDLGDHQKQ